MDKLRRKLHSSRGASMLMALLYLTVALILGASVLAAAQVNAGRIGRNKAEQQAYYTLHSAAQLIQQDMSGAKLSFSRSTTVTKTWDTREGEFGPESTRTSAGDIVVSTDSALMYSLNLQLKEFYAVEGGAQTSKSMGISFAPLEELAQVDGSVTLYRGGSDSYKVVFELYTQNDDERSGELKLSFAPIIESSTERSESTDGLVNTVTTVDTTTISWDKPVITGGEPA